MNLSLDDFRSWAGRFASTLPGDATVDIQSSDELVYMDVQISNGPLGRLLYRADGSADVSVFDAAGNLVNFAREDVRTGLSDRVSPLDFDVAFLPFVEQFTTMD